MYILGINAYHGDSSACIINDGEIIAAVEEERFRRIKHWAGFPSEAINYCLEETGISPREISHVGISRNPSAHLHRKVLFSLSKRPSFSMIKDRMANVAKVKDIRNEFCKALELPFNYITTSFHNVEHHRAHMASSFFLSPFEDAAILSIDGFGDFVSTMWGVGLENKIKILGSVGFPHSLGLFYTAVTQYLGFLKYGDEYKVMGLAAYGEPEYVDDLEKIVRLKKNGDFELELDCFLHHSEGVDMTWEGGEPNLGKLYSDQFIKRFGPPRNRGEELTKRHENLASSLQVILEEAYFHVLNSVYEKTKKKALCLAGGVAFNSVANGKIFDNTPFEEVYIQAAAGDAGTALGAAYYIYHQVLGRPRKFEMKHAFWGPGFSNGNIERALKDSRSNYEVFDEDLILKKAAQAISEGKVVGWFQGRMEWGPRALGNRSILVDPRRKDMKDILNARIKRREPFRPFAPSILIESVGDYFEKTYPDPFMIKVYPIKKDKRGAIPAVTHVDGTGRLQTVSRDENPIYWKLIKEFEKLTGVPVVLNTSFNENEPIVCTPQEAIDCFSRTKMDLLVIGNYYVEKDAQSN